MAQEREVAWFLSKPERIGSDRIRFIPAHQPDRQLIAVIITREGIAPLTYSQNLRGIIDNPLRGTFTILFGNEDGGAAYATFRSRRYEAYLTFLKAALTI